MSHNDQPHLWWVDAASETLIVMLCGVGFACRYRTLKTIGKSSDSFSCLLWNKIAASILLVLLRVSAIYYLGLNTVHLWNKQWICGVTADILYTLLLGLAIFMLIMEHKSRLSEKWYSHKMLYVFNII